MSAADLDETGAQVYEWQPGELLDTRVFFSPRPRPNFALIVLNQPLHEHLDVIRDLWDIASVRVAADGGANRLFEAAGQHGDYYFDNLDLIIGDLDSLTAPARAYYEGRGTQVVIDPDQYSTDFGKAVAWVRGQHPQRQQQEQQQQDEDQEQGQAEVLDIVAVGGLGGRVDQGLSQLHHLYLFQTDARYAQGRMYLFSGESLTFVLKAGRHRIRVREPQSAGQGARRVEVFGKHVGILPLGEPSRITTQGLEWDVQDWETSFGGQVSTSNHVLPETEVVVVETTRDVLFTIALRQP